MFKNLLWLALIFSTSSLFSQINFEEAYFIQNDNVLVKCLIKNVGWKNNPESFEYILSIDQEPKTQSISDVKEFSIYGEFKYIRATVDMDTSSNNLSKQSLIKNPEFIKKTLFLEVLLEGQASLYSYKQGNLSRYFFSKNQGIEQLVYKTYLTEENKLGKNYQFRQQLFTALSCKDISTRDFENIDYYTSDLSKLFVRYNQCVGSETLIYKSDIKKDWFNLTIRPGVSFSSLSITNSSFTNRNRDYGRSSSLRLGLEAEIVLPFNKNKWTIIVEPTYRNYSGEDSGREAVYNSLEFPVGVRHYLFLNDSSKIFINAAAVFDVPLNEILDRYDLDSQINFALGTGFTFMSRYSMELRYFTNRQLLNGYAFLGSEFTTFSLIFGYTLF
jgi:hypothetical protein